MAPTAGKARVSETGSVPESVFLLSTLFVEGVSLYDSKKDPRNLESNVDCLDTSTTEQSIFKKTEQLILRENEHSTLTEKEGAINHANASGKGESVLERTANDSKRQDEQEGQGESGGEKWSCLGCGRVAFESLEEQRAHFKSDWHRLNVKRRLGHKEPFSLEAFEALIENGRNSDVESISGSESEEDEGPSERKPSSHRSARIAFQTATGVPFSMWRNLIGGEREQLFGFHEKVLSPEEAVGQLKALADPGRGPWVVLLLSGGHFAGAVFDPKGQVLVHSTAHRYVVRAKQGGRQSAKDNTGRAPKSGGASLRRYNEAALEKDVKEMLASWQEHLRTASLIFVRASSADQKTLFMGESPPLHRDDPRLRRIPFVTRRPTFSETKRVVHLLASLDTRPEMMPVLIPPENEISKPVPKPKPPKPSKAAAPEPEPIAEAVPSLMTPLHFVAEEGDEAKLKELLEGGADPCVKDERGRTPYMAAKEKGPRNVFRRFMAAFPDRWDYSLSAIPSPLTDDQEAAQEAKRAEKAAKRKEVLKERKKEKRVQDEIKRKEEEAKKKEEEAAQLEAAAAAAIRYGKGKGLKAAPLSKAEKEEALLKARQAEREMRAKAALKRLQPVEQGVPKSVESTSNGQESSSANACDCCGDSLDGKVPFHRLNFKYCSTTCVRVHKQAMEEYG